MTSERTLKRLGSLVGSWTTEATHPELPGVVARGTATIEWLEGERFVIQRTHSDHPDFPDAIAIIGFTERDRVGDAPESAPRLTLHYFDSRGVFRVYEASIDDEAWRFSRDAPGFSQRFVGTFADGGDTIVGRFQLRRDVEWTEDVQITYRRRA
jgi:hypothetical protein